MTTANFLDRMLESAPEVQPLLEDHLVFFDEVLLHLLVASFRDMAIEAFDRRDLDLASRIVGVMDEGLRMGDARVEDAVAVSFVEDTPWWDAARKRFVKSWPQALRDEVERQADSRQGEGLI